MHNLYILTFLSFAFLFPFSASAQIETLTFEEEISMPDTFRNGQDGTESFELDPISFPVVYDFDFDIWSGQWALSSDTDSVTPNFTNLYGSRAGGGAEGSDVFMVGQSPFGAENLQFTSATPISLQSVDITNSTYAYFVIKDGNQFSKAFGGPSGDDPDYFFIRWKGYLQGQLTDSVDIYLADYRFSDNSQDYILEDWTSFNLEALGAVDQVEVEFYSSDTGEFGINTPLFFNLDNLTSNRTSSDESQVLDASFSLYPNPVRNTLRWKSDVNISTMAIYDMNGKLLSSWKANRNEVDVHSLAAGAYVIVAQTSEGVVRRVIIKQ
jgi:hypothetical protein